MDVFKAGERFADTGEFDGFAGDVAHRQRGAAAGITVELGEHHAGERQRFVEGAGRVDRVLTQHRINHEKRFDRVDGGVELADFGHHRFINRESAGGVDQQHIVKMTLGEINRSAGDVDRFLIGRRREEINARLLGDSAQLLDGGRTIDVTGYGQHFFLLSFAEQLAELACGGGLTRTLQASHEDDGRRLSGKAERGMRAAHQGGEFAMNHADQGLTGRE